MEKVRAPTRTATCPGRVAWAPRAPPPAAAAVPPPPSASALPGAGGSAAVATGGARTWHRDRRWAAAVETDRRRAAAVETDGRPVARPAETAAPDDHQTPPRGTANATRARVRGAGPRRSMVGARAAAPRGAAHLGMQRGTTGGDGRGPPQIAAKQAWGQTPTRSQHGRGKERWPVQYQGGRRRVHGPVPGTGRPRRSRAPGGRGAGARRVRWRCHRQRGTGNGVGRVARGDSRGRPREPFSLADAPPWRRVRFCTRCKPPMGSRGRALEGVARS